MTIKNTKTVKVILFASLIAAVILSFNMVENAQAVHNVQDEVERSNEKYDFLSKAVSKTGTWESKIITDEHTELWKYNVVENADQTKHVALNILIYNKQGEKIGNYDIEFKTKYDSTTDTYDVYNTMLDERKKISKESGSNSLLTDGDIRVNSKIQTDGIVVPGSSTTVIHTWMNPVVDPNDEFGNDAYSQCGNRWYTDFMSNGSSGLRWYSFSGQYYYLDWCVFPDAIDRVYVKALQGDWSESDRKHSHIGSHSEHDIDVSDWLTLKVEWHY